MLRHLCLALLVCGLLAPAAARADAQHVVPFSAARRLSGHGVRDIGQADTINQVGGVTGVGDFNGDGRSDYAFFADNPASTEDASGYSVNVLFGGPGRTSDVARPSLMSPGMSVVLPMFTNDVENRGAAPFFVAPAGDVNGDGLQDLAITAHIYSPSDAVRPLGWIVYGRRGVGETVDVRRPGDWGFALTGHGEVYGGPARVAGVGDVDGDGLADVGIAGAPPVENAHPPGTAWVVLGRYGAERWTLHRPDGTTADYGTDLNACLVAAAAISPVPDHLVSHEEYEQMAHCGTDGPA